MNKIKFDEYNVQKERYEKFIKESPLCDFQQSTKWAKVKEFWRNEIIIIENDKKEILATANILIRKIPLFGNLMYIPRGPIGYIEKEDVFSELTRKIVEIADEYKAFAVIVEPNIKIDNDNFQKLAIRNGFYINSKAVKFDQEIQARHNFRLNLEGKTEDEIFKGFSYKTRYNIKQAKKKGVEIKERNIEGIEEFYELMKETGERDHFRIRPKEYFSDIMTEFSKEAKILIAYYNEKPIATVMPILYGNKMWYLYGASGNSERNRMPNYLLQWETIKLAIRNNCRIYDFRGVCIDKEENGLYRFKKGFGGDLVELIGEIYIPFKPMKYRLFKITKRIFFKLRDWSYWAFKRFRKEKDVIEKGMIACENSEVSTKDCFLDIKKPIISRKGQGEFKV